MTWNPEKRKEFMTAHNLDDYLVMEHFKDHDREAESLQIGDGVVGCSLCGVIIWKNGVANELFSLANPPLGYRLGIYHHWKGQHYRAFLETTLEINGGEASGVVYVGLYPNARISARTWSEFIEYIEKDMDNGGRYKGPRFFWVSE